MIPRVVERGTIRDRVSRVVAVGGGPVHVARRAGVSESAVRSWCDGTAVPASDSLAKLCDACGVSADWILGLNGGRTPDAGR